MIIEKDISVCRVGVDSFGITLPKWWCLAKGMNPKDKLRCIMTEHAIILCRKEDYEIVKNVYLKEVE